MIYLFDKSKSAWEVFALDVSMANSIEWSLLNFF